MILVQRLLTREYDSPSVIMRQLSPSAIVTAYRHGIFTHIAKIKRYLQSYLFIEEYVAQPLITILCLSVIIVALLYFAK